jgi:CheY-like chemotaxis protein
MVATRKKILLIEDNPQTAEFYQEFLSSEYDVDLAADGEIGLQTLSRNAGYYSLVLLDIMLPKKDGVEVLKIRQNDPILSSVPVVLLTNYNEKAVIHECLELGAQACLMKSDITPDKILKIVNNTIK